MRDARRGETKDSEHVVRGCKAMAEEESWSGWNQVEEQGCENQSRKLGRSPDLEFKDKSGRFAKNSPNNEAVLGRCSF